MNVQKYLTFRTHWIISLPLFFKILPISASEYSDFLPRQVSKVRMSTCEASSVQKRATVIGEEEAPQPKSSRTDSSDVKKGRVTAKGSSGPSFPPLSSTKRLVLLVLEYDGSNFKGWQSQSSSQTISESAQLSSDQFEQYIPGVKGGKHSHADSVRTVNTRALLAPRHR